MTYSLVGTERSPFATICRLFMIHHGLKFDFRTLEYLTSEEDSKQLAKENPINKLPFLVAGNETIFDSRVICSFLTRKHQLPIPTVEQENITSAVYGAIDVYVNLFLLKKGGVDIEASNWFFDRQRARIPEILKYVTPFAKAADETRSDDWNLGTMSLYTFLYWATTRGFLSLDENPELTSFLKRFAKAPGVAETDYLRRM